MKLHRVATTTAAITAALLLAGTLDNATARNHERTVIRHQESRTEVRKKKQRRPKKRVAVTHSRRSHKRAAVRHKAPRRVVHRSLPHGYRTVRVANKPYYYSSGTYYRHCHGGYEVVRTPRIRYLPRHARRVVVNHSVYYVCDDVYYTSCGNYYEICEAPHIDTRLILNAGPLTIVLSDHDCDY